MSEHKRAQNVHRERLRGPPCHDAVEESGMGEEEIEALLDNELHAVRAARRLRARQAMISAVFDSTTLLQAAATPRGPAKACLTCVDEGHVKGNDRVC